MRKIVSILVMVFLICQSGMGQEYQDLILKGVNVIDGRNNLLPNRDVVIRNSIITEIIESGSGYIPDSVMVLDLKGKFVLPGLIESHTHFGMRERFESTELTEQEFRRWIYSGVTAVREMGGDARLSSYDNRLIARNEMPGPDIYFAATLGGPDMMRKDLRQIGATQGIGVKKAPWVQTITNDMDIANSIAQVKGTQATGIKMYAGIHADLIKRLTDEAHKQGLKSWSHLTVFPDRPLEVVKAGVDVVTHTWGAFWQDPNVDPSRRIPFTHTSFENARDAIFPSNMEKVNVGEPEIQLLFEEMVNRNTIWDVTYSIAIGNLKIREVYADFLRSASDKGVKFSTGTDWFNDISEPFPSLYEEIEALVNDGILTEMQVIEAATFTGARTIGIEDTHGSVEVGKVANMIVLNASPLDDISALKSIMLTIKKGQLYWRKDY